MSIGELAMLVNDNFDKPLNQQIRDMQYIGSYLFTSSTTFTPDKSGYYKVIVVGAGGEANASKKYRGASGGVAISTLLLNSSNSYAVTITSAKSSFENINATNATDATSSAEGVGGIATGGDFNYNGIDSTIASTTPYSGNDVGVFIPPLMRKESSIKFNNSNVITLETGYGILGFGAGGGGNHVSGTGYTGDSGAGCVLIIPLELTE